ncbi:MAG: glutamate 5-kinase [Acidimicrobiia bacterium]|nr:glutamate 5-kinase [Acidimicrobiia bacterium]
MTVVVKIGTSSLTDQDGSIATDAIERLCAQVAELRSDGRDVVIVTSGAIESGRAVLGLEQDRARDSVTLQAVSAVGQTRLMRVYEGALAEQGLVGGQVLLAPLDFFERSQYLHARGTLGRLLELGVVPIVNENDVIADDAIRFGDNDRIAALVANLLKAEVLVLLTDTPGVLTADPRIDQSASLIQEILEIDRELEAVVTGPGRRGSGGMASKLSAARIAAWSGVRTVIAAANRDQVLIDAVAAKPGVGTSVVARDVTLPAKKLWIAFAVRAEGILSVDAGAQRALIERGTSLLAVGIADVQGDFAPGDAVEIAGPDGQVFAKGLVAMQADEVRGAAGQRSADRPGNGPDEVIHRDDMVILP